MASLSFPEVSDEMKGEYFLCYVLYNPVTEKFYGATTGNINYGWTDTPQVVVEGGVHVTPQSRTTAERILDKVLYRWREYTAEEEALYYPGQKDLTIVQIKYWRDGSKWEFVE